MGAIAQQPGFKPVLRRDLLSAVNQCSRDLGLRPSSVVVLDALLSCLPCQSPDGRETPIAPTILLTVYASNETLCFRSKGITDRQLRRHLEVLERQGLILRRDSANGKRFPVFSNGKAIGAFGIDLTPLLVRSEEILTLARQRKEEATELRGLRAQVLCLRSACLAFDVDEATEAFLDGLRRLIRRATLTLTEAKAALSQIRAILASRTPSTVPQVEDMAVANTGRETISEARIETSEPISDEPCSIAAREACSIPEGGAPSNKMTASDGQNVRHKEHESKTKKRSTALQPNSSWEQLTTVNAFYSAPENEKEAARIAYDFGRLLRISHDLLAKAAQSLGTWKLLDLEDRMASQIDRISSPDAYLACILRSS